ncbi:MAG: heavy-metal-associated domain-containing protein, partial [Bacteroidia bacterium]|nr:heavy-metal-associated domain-containing protein [Bacteroidia bacterium]
MTDNSKKISLQVEGMTCANCALGITRSVQKSGGENVTVNYISGEAHFNLTSPEKLAQVIDNINALGYKVIDSTKKEDSKSNSLSLEKKFYICL